MKKQDIEKCCDFCKHCDEHRWGCRWRDEISMLTDKSPCMNFYPNKDEISKRHC